MKNSVSGAKLGTCKNSCSLADIRYWEDVTFMYEIDENGEPVVEVDHTDGDFRCYWCTGCDEELGSFEAVKEHLCKSE